MFTNLDFLNIGKPWVPNNASFQDRQENYITGRRLYEGDFRSVFESAWQKIKDCMHFWLLKLDLAILVLTVLATFILPAAGIYDHADLWIAPVLSAVLFFLTYSVAYLGGEWNDEDKEFDIDSLFAILLFALLPGGAFL